MKFAKLTLLSTESDIDPNLIRLDDITVSVDLYINLSHIAYFKQGRIEGTTEFSFEQPCGNYSDSVNVYIAVMHIDDFIKLCEK